MANNKDDAMDPTHVKRNSQKGAQGDEMSGSEGIDDQDRPQGSDESDGNGAGFTGQGGQKESNSKKGEGTGYTNG